VQTLTTKLFFKMEELATDWPDSYYGNKYLDRPDAATMLRPKTHVLEHTSLGNMTGVRYADTPEVVRYRGIPYATLPGRFKRSILRDNLDGLSRNFTKPGYACPHTFEMDDVHSGGPYPGEKPIQTSEFDSLILEVNVPHSIEAPTPPGGYPVMVYIHGGAYVLGKIDAQHNTAYMAQHSVTLSEPVITVAIQYRLGALGFMATPDGSKNLGLWDQRNALLWVQKFIAGFDGNPSRVTLFGESAGGYSICCHMLSHQPSSGPLFNRVIIMSGVMGPLQIPLPEDEAGKAFEDICLDLGIEERGESAIKKLQSLDVETIVSASDAWNAKGNMWSPVDDPSFFKTKVTWDNVHYHLEDCAGVDDMIVGNTGFEGQAFLNVANSMTPASFLEYLKLELSNSAAKRIMEAYEITLDMDQNTFLTAAMCWIGDVVFNSTPHQEYSHSFY
jgi:carboxylesterase type B